MMEEPAEANYSKFEEYKLLVEDTAHFSDRRQTVTIIYVTVNSILLGGIGLLLRDVTPNGDMAGKLGLIIPLLAIGIAACSIWLWLIRRYRVVIGERIDILKDMERSPGMQGCQEIYHKLNRMYAEGPSFAGIEAILPILFIVIYAAGILAVLCLWCHLSCWNMGT
jgi:hypothetical protein